MKIFVIIYFALLSGCSYLGLEEASTESSSSLNGSYMYLYSDSKGEAWKFDGNKYLFATMVMLSTNEANTETENGTFSVSNKLLTLKPEKSTCKSKTLKAYSLEFAINDQDGLKLSYSNVMMIYQKIPKDTQKQPFYKYNYGCFDEKGNFEKVQ